MRFRYWIAGLICPEMAEHAALWRYAEQQYRVAHQWLSEFQAICDTLDWVFIGARDYLRPMGAPSQCQLPGSIDRFRDHLHEISNGNRS